MRLSAAIAFCAVVATLAVAATPLPDSLFRLYATRDFEAAGQLLDELAGAATRPTDRLAVRLEQGDYLLDKRGEPAAAEAVYQELITEFPKDPVYPDLVYRLALAQELQEKYLEAAQNYEVVATRHMKSRFGSDALDAIERCFRKNYQDRVAYVDGYPLTRIEFDDRVSRYPSNYEQYERKEFLLDTMIDNRLLYRAAIEADLAADPAFASEYWDMRNRYVFEEWYAHRITSRADPTEKEIRAQYARDRDSRFTTPEKVHGWQLVVERRELADSLRKLLLGAGAPPWETLSARFSTASDQERGGDLGLFSRGMRDKAIEDAAFKLKPGQVSQPVRLDTGWALVRVTDRTKKTVRPYAEVRSQLAVQVRQDKTNRLYEERSEQLRRDAAVIIDTAALEEGREVIGSVDGVTITAAELARRLEQIPAFFRAQFETPEGLRRILDQMVLEQLILTDAEANDDWLWNTAVGRVLERRARMLVDHYTRTMTADRVTIDTAEMKADYHATIDEFKVPARARGREITAPTRARAELLRGWVRNGRLPALLAGRALLVTSPDGNEDVIAALADDEPDTLLAARGFSDRPRAILPGTPTLRVANRLLPDLAHRCPLAGPFAAEGAHAFAFDDFSQADTLFVPELVEARNGEALAALLGIAPERDAEGAVIVDDARLGTYVRLINLLASREQRRLLGLEPGATIGPLATADGELFIRVTRKDAPASATFEDVARRFSAAPTRHSGGDLSWLSRDDKSRDQKLVDAVFGIGVGAISPVIRLNDSTWTFVKNEERQQAYTRPFDEVMPKIEGKLRRQKTEDLRAQLVADLRGSADIEVLMTPEDFLFELPGETPLPEPDDTAPQN
ncbi:MAG: peptidyl-prolyl cis-trans isomerase [bacterium]